MSESLLLIACVAAGTVLGLSVGILALLLRKTAPRYFVRTWQPLTPEQWAAAFRQWPDSDPRWRALWDLLAFHLEAELASAEGVGTDPHAICLHHGRVQMVLFLRSQILNLRKAD